MGVAGVNSNAVSISTSNFGCGSSSLAHRRRRSTPLPFIGLIPNTCREKVTCSSMTSRPPARHQEGSWLPLVAHSQLCPVSPRMRSRLPQASKNGDPQMAVKTATLTAGRKETVLLSDYGNAVHAEFPFNEFLCHPSGVEAILNIKALQSFECLDSNTYRCTLPKLQFLKYEVIPITDLRVTYVKEGCIIELLSCKFEGSEILKQQNDRFSAFMRNHITWDLENSEPYLDFDVHLSVTLQIYTKPFTMLPVSAVETPGNLYCVEEDIRDRKGGCSRCGAPYSLAQEDLKDDHDDQSGKGLAMTAYNGDNQDEGLHARKVSSFSTVDSEFNSENGNPIWKSRVESWKEKKNNKKTTQKKEAKPAQVPQGQQMDEKELTEPAQSFSRVVPISRNKLTSYRLVIIMRLIILGLFFHYRITHPVDSAFGLWLTSIICEIWFAVSWVLDQFPKWSPMNRETYIDRLSARYEIDGDGSALSAVDFFVSTVDPLKEPPLITANTVLSILAVDYPVDKVSCYVSDDGSAMLTFESLAETAEFARKWVPFCKKHLIEPRAPEFYFSQKIDYLKDKVQPSFVKERRAMKRDYEEYKVRINALVAKAQKTPDDGWVMQDGTPWPGNNPRDHPGMIQVFLGNTGAHDIEGNELPRLVYVSREKRPGYQHHKKAGAMNALVRVSAVLTNAPYILNLDCDHYVNNSKAVREAMCFMMDPQVGHDVCYIQFPQRFDGIDRSDRYANRNIVFFDINMKGLDGIQGPMYVGTGCVFNRQALYGYSPPSLPSIPKGSFCSSCCCCCCCCKRSSKEAKDQAEIYRDAKREDLDAAIFNLKEIDNYDEYDRSLLLSQISFEKTFGLSSVFIESTMMEFGGVPESVNPSTLIKEAIHVISCGYEEKTEWGKEIGWIYGSVTEDILTGFKMHCRGWRSIYCMPLRPAFKGSAPINLSDRLHQVLRWALGSVEIFLSRHCPLWYGCGAGRLKWLQRLAYVNTIVYPFTSLPLVAYCSLPAICLLTGKFIIPTLSNVASMLFLALFISIILTSVLELRWSGVGIEDWWRNEQFWVIGGVSAHLFAVFQGFLKMLAGLDTNFTVTAKAADDAEFGDLYVFKWTTLLIPPTTLLILNLVGVVAGFSDALNSGYEAWGPLFGKVFFALWVVLHLYPFLKGLMGRQNRTPTIVVLWSVLLASVFSLLWVKVDPFFSNGNESVATQSCSPFDC